MKYITNFLGVCCVALLAMLIMAPGAFAQVQNPPPAPTGVEAEATENTAASITIKWSQVDADDTDLPLLPGTAGYVVEVTKDPTNANSWATSTEIVVTVPTAATEKASAVHTLTGTPTHNQTRHYRVRAESGAGRGAPSAVVMATTHTVPDPPSDVAAVPGQPTATDPQDGRITISWSPVGEDDNGGLAVAEDGDAYVIQVTDDPTDDDSWATSTDITVTPADTDADPVVPKYIAIHDLTSATPPYGVTRHYRVRAVNAAVDVTASDVKDHIVGAWSTVVSGTTHDIPDAPTGVTLEVENADNTNTEREIKVTWNEVLAANNGGLAITGYTVEHSSDQGATWTAITPNTVSVSGGKLDTTHTGLTPADPVVTYYYRVSAASAASPAVADGGRNYSSVIGLKLGPPGAPNDLKVVAVDGIEAMDLSWTAPENDEEPPVTAYRIEKAGTGGDTPVNFSDDDDDTNDTWTVLSERYTGRAFRDRGLTAGVTYGYRVSAINAVATGAATAGVGAISSNKALMPRNLTATLSDDMGSIELTWDRPVADGDKPANGGSPISGYKIEASKDAGATWADVEEDKEEHPESELLTPGEVTEYAYEHEDLDHGASYIYRVSAITDAGPGAASTPSAAVSTAAVKPGAPGSLTATAAEDMNTITLMWPAPASNGGAAITSWKIEVSEGATVGTWADLDLTVTDPADPMADDAMYSAVHTGLTAGATYHYRVSATNSVGTGDPSAVAMATAVDIPNAPKDLTAVADGETTINLSWEAPDDNEGAAIASYKIEVSEDGGTTWEDLDITVTNPADPDADGARYTASHTGLDPGTTRHYRVSAINSADPAKTGAASNVANATTAARGVVTRYAVPDDGGTTGECTDAATPCTLGAVLSASSASFDDLILVRVRRAGETATIREDITINKMVTLGVYVRGASAAGKGAVSFSGTVTLADGANVMTHKDATVHFDEVEISGSPSIDKLVVRDDLTISEDDPDNDETSVLAVDELTVNSGQTLSLGQGADVRVRLSKGDVGKMNGKLDVKGTIDGTGDLWIAHTSGERSASGFTLHEPGDYLPGEAIAPSKVKFTPDDCLMVTGGGTVENDLHAVAAGNVCVALEEIGNLVAVGSIDGTEDITTDVIFRNAVTVTGNVEQWNDARVVFEKNAMIEGDVTLTRGDGGVGATFGTPNSDPDDFERAMNSGVEFGGLSNTIEGDLDLEFDGSSGGTQVLFSVNSSQDHTSTVATSTVEGDLVVEDGGTINLEGAPGVRTDKTNNPRAHNLTVEGDVFVYANAEIMMEHAATSSIHAGLCSAPGLRFGNKVMLEGDLVFTDGTSLTIETVVITDNVEVEEEGTLIATTVHVTADGELDADDNVQVGDAIILQGDGLEGTLAAGSTLNNITYATVDSDEIAMGSAVTRLSVNVGANRELRISDAVTVTNLGLCSGTLVLIDTDSDDNTLTVTEHLTVMDGYMSLDSNRPGTAGTDVSKPNAAAADGYILEYVTAGERMAGAEWFAPRKVAVNHDDAVVIVNEAKSLTEGVHIFKGHLHMKGDDSHLTVGMASSVSGISPFVMVDNGELHSNGNNVVVNGTVTVVPGDKKTGKIVTGGGELHVLGQNPKGVYTNESAVATVGVGGTIDVGTGALQLGPAYTAAANGLEGDARPDVTLTLTKTDKGMGTVTGKIYVPAGSKQTSINGEAFDTVVLDAAANPKKVATGAGNWGGGLNFHDTKVTIDSLAAMNDGAVEFYDQGDVNAEGYAITIAKDVELNSARIYVNQNNSLKFGGDLTFGKTGGMRAWDESSVTVMGDYTQNKGSQHAGHQDGMGLAGANMFTVMGDFMVADSAHRFESNENTSIVLKGDFHFGMVMTGSDKMLNAMLEFSGKEAQMAGSEVDLGDVMINNSKGLVLSDTMSQGATSMLTLTSGVISSDMHPWVLKNTDIEEDVRGRNNALTTCDSDENCAYVIKGGTRRAHVTTGVSRHVMKGNSGEGEMSGGYLFPVGGMSGDRAHYRPLILQLEDDLSEAMPVTVSPMMGSDDPGEINIVVPVQGGSLTLNAYADMFWKVESKEAPDQNSHIRIAASGLANVFDDSRLRMVQWDCDWSNARLAGMQIVGSDADSFAENGYVNGVLNLTQRSVETGTCAILGVAANGIENPIHMDPLTGGLARIQFIHNLPLPFPVDLFLDGVKLMGGLNFQSATGYGHYAAGDHVISVMPVVPPGVPAAPIEIPLPSLVNEQNYAVVAHGSVADPRIQILSTKLRSSVDNMVDAILVHGSGDLGDVDVRILDPADNMTPTKLLANNFSFNSATRYISLEPGAHNVQVTSPDNREEVNVYYLDLNGYQGETLVLNLSGGKDDLGFMGVRTNGNVFLSQVVTGVEEEGNPEIPTEFTLHGNYPNPFNPSTRIQFDLPESAQVTLQVVDMLGRQVMTLPAKQVEAGANRTLELSATNLASGQYLYRIIATGAESQYVKTGRMTLVK